MTPDHGGIRLQGDRNFELAFVNLLRQLDADNDASRIVERFESQHRSQSPLYPAVAEAEPGRRDPSFSARFLKVATHPANSFIENVGSFLQARRIVRNAATRTV